jgi:hypothetical protein
MLSVLPVLLTLALANSADFVVHRDLKRFVFASCSKTDHNQSIFLSITAKNPELFVWLGDAGFDPH